jgi:hypothetical protein
MSEQAKRIRRWVDHSLQVLLIVLLLLAVAVTYVSRQVEIVSKRAHLIHSSYLEFSTPGNDGNLSWIRRQLGDKAYKLIYVHDAPSEVVDRFKTEFPEAAIIQRGFSFYPNDYLRLQ